MPSSSNHSTSVHCQYFQHKPNNQPQQLHSKQEHHNQSISNTSKEFKPKFILKAKDMNSSSTVRTPTAAPHNHQPTKYEETNESKHSYPHQYNNNRSYSENIHQLEVELNEASLSGSQEYDDHDYEEIGMLNREGYEYDNMRETFRKYEEEQKEIRRLTSINRHYRAQLLRVNTEHQAEKQKNSALEATIQKLMAERNQRDSNQQTKFNNALCCIGTILREVQDALGNRSSVGLDQANQKIAKVINCLDQYSGTS